MLLIPFHIKCLLLIVIFICLLALLIRFAINFSYVLVSVVLVKEPNVWTQFLLTEPYFDPVKGSTVNNSGWFSRYNYHHHYGLMEFHLGLQLGRWLD